MKRQILNTTIIALFLFLISGLIMSCDGLSSNDDSIKVTEGFAGVDLNIQGTLPVSAGQGKALADSVSISVTDTLGAEIGTLVLTEARFALNEIELEQEDSEIDTEEEEAQSLDVEYEGPFIISLLEGTITPELPYIEVMPGTYESLKLKLEKIEQEDELALLDAGDPLIGNSIYMTGTYTGSTSTVDVIDMPFSFTFALDEEFELMSSASDYSGFIIDEGVINSIIVAFRFDQWFAFNNSETNSDQLIDFTDIVPTGSEIILNDTQNGDNVTIREIIKDNIKESADYGEDEDDDGVLESDEDED